MKPLKTKVWTLVIAIVLCAVSAQPAHAGKGAKRILKGGALGVVVGLATGGSVVKYAAIGAAGGAIYHAVKGNGRPSAAEQAARNRAAIDGGTSADTTSEYAGDWGASPATQGGMTIAPSTPTTPSSSPPGERNPYEAYASVGR